MLLAHRNSVTRWYLLILIPYLVLLKEMEEEEFCWVNIGWRMPASWAIGSAHDGQRIRTFHFPPCVRCCSQCDALCYRSRIWQGLFVLCYLRQACTSSCYCLHWASVHICSIPPITICQRMCAMNTAYLLLIGGGWKWFFCLIVLYGSAQRLRRYVSPHGRCRKKLTSWGWTDEEIYVWRWWQSLHHIFFLYSSGNQKESWSRATTTTTTSSGNNNQLW